MQAVEEVAWHGGQVSGWQREHTAAASLTFSASFFSSSITNCDSAARHWYLALREVVILASSAQQAWRMLTSHLSSSIALSISIGGRVGIGRPARSIATDFPDATDSNVVGMVGCS